MAGSRAVGSKDMEPTLLQGEGKGGANTTVTATRDENSLLGSHNDGNKITGSKGCGPGRKIERGTGRS